MALIRLANWIFIGLLINADAVWATDPYGGTKFYFGDTHFHTGYSGDNRDDQPPIAAFLTALGNSKRKSDGNSTSRDSELGGYFLFTSDHLQYVPTRWDMTDEMYQRGKEQENDPRLEIANSSFTFTAFVGAEFTGLARGDWLTVPWDDKFGHINIFNLPSIGEFEDHNVLWNWSGTDAMDALARYKGAVAQFNHPGYNGEPRTGNNADDLYPYTRARDEAFDLFEVSDGNANNWNVGVAQYQIALQNGYHLSPTIGSDTHGTQWALSISPETGTAARTVVIAQPTIGLSAPERRKILLDAIKSGVVYATEDADLKLKVDADGFAIGHVFESRPNSLNIHVNISFVSNSLNAEGEGLQKIEIVRNKRCERDGNVIAMSEVRDLTDCSEVLAERHFDNSNLEGKYPRQFDDLFMVPTPGDDMKYLFVLVTQSNGSRAITTPFYFY
jgi:hypothetical protein